MKHNGFTLIELMAVIIILGIIVALSTPIYNKITKNLKEKEYQNKVAFIETKAEKYASERSVLIASVQELVDEGFLDADNDNGDVINPIDQSRMNCDIIVTTMEDDTFHATLTEEKNCSKKEQLQMKNDLKLFVISKNSARLNSLEYSKKNIWENDNVQLEAFLPKEYQNQKVTWLQMNDKVSENTYQYKTNIQNVLNSIFTVMVTATKDGKEITLSQSVRIKIDKQAPMVDPENSIVLGNDIFSGPTKEIQIEGNDYNGSGIAEDGYYIGDKVTSCRNVIYEKIKIKNFGQGTYSLCVKDAVGNVSKPYDVTVKNIDNIPPVITAIVEKNDVWTNSNKKIVATGTDHSGIKGYYFSEYIEKCPTELSKYRSTNTKSAGKGKYSICAVDNLGNITPTPTQVEVKMIEKTFPEIKLILPENWTNKGPVKIGIQVTDTESGVDESSYKVCSYEKQEDCKSFAGNYFETNYERIIVYANDKAGNKGFIADWSRLDITPPYTPHMVAYENTSMVCTKNDDSSYEDNECVKNNTSEEWGIGINEWNLGGWYFMMTDKSGNITYSKRFLDASQNFPWIPRNRIGYIWVVDKAGNVSPGKLIIRVG